MLKRRELMQGAAGAALLPSLSFAQGGWPNRPVHIVVGYSAGGGSDSIGRLFAQLLSDDMGQPFIVENKPGAGGNIAADYVAHGNDDHRLLFGVGAHVINASLYPKIPYDPIKDFSPLSLIALAPNMLAARPTLGVKNIKDVIAMAKAEPGKLSYSSPGTGTPMHLAMELFASMAGIKLIHVPYKGGGDSVQSTLGGQTDLLTMSVPTVLPHIRSGKLQALGVTSRTKNSQVADVPTVEEAASLPGYEALAWYGLLAPAKMPVGSVQQLNAAIRKQLGKAEVRDKLQQQGFEPSPDSPEEFRRFLVEDMEKWAKVVKASGARVE